MFRSTPLALAGGAALALPHVLDVWLHPLAGGLLAMAGVGVLYLALQKARSPLAAAWAGWAGGFVHFCILLHWLTHPFLISADRHLWALPFAAMLLPAGLSLYWTGAFWAARRWQPSVLWRPAWFTAAFTSAEWLRGSLLTEFPWGLAGYVWIDTPLRDLLPIMGVYALTLLTVLTAAAAAALATKAPLPQLARLPAAIALAAVATSIGWGVGKALPSAPLPSAGAPTLRLVQPNIPQREKWMHEYRTRNIARVLTHSSSTKGKNPDLVVWPESALPIVVPHDDSEHLGSIAAEFGLNVPLAAGMLTSDKTGAYNSLALFERDGSLRALYDKRHLVPFGEYLPLRGVFEFLGFDAFTGGGYRVGSAPALLELDGLPPLAAFICYEVISPARARRTVQGAEWMLQVTNDAWFGPGAGPRQHLTISRARAAELGLPLARAANTGISAIIDARGQVLASLRLGAEGALDWTLPPPLATPTLYARHGDFGFGLLLAIGLLGSALSRRRIDPMACSF